MFATFLKKTNETCNDAETDFNDIGRKRNLAENKFRSDSTSLIFFAQTIIFQLFSRVVVGLTFSCFLSRQRH